MSMKFSKTLAISLLALSTMQLAKAEKITIDLKNQNPGAVAINQHFNIGDQVELLFTEKAGSTGIIHEVVIPLPNYLTQQPDTYDAPTSRRPGASGIRHMLFTIQAQPQPEDSPLKISYGNEVFLMRFNNIAPAKHLSTKKGDAPLKQTEKPVIDIDLTEKTGGAIDLIELIQARGENKALFETGDIIHLLLSENPTTGSRLMLSKEQELPKYLKKLCETYEAPARRPMVFNPTSCQMEEAEPMAGASGKKHLILEIAPLKNLIAEELSKPLIISSARSWETDRPETYKISFKLPPTVVATSETKPASVMGRPIKPSGNK